MSRRAKIALGLGTAALLATACSAGTTPAPTDAEAWFAFGLERNQAGLVERLQEIATPDADRYEQYLSVAKIAVDYGADADLATQVTDVLTAAGFSGGVDASGGLVVGSFSVAEAQSFFGVEIALITNSDGTTSIAPTQTLTVPDTLPAQVTEVFGGRATLSSLSDLASANPSTSATDPDCPDGESAASNQKEVAELYGLKPLYDDGLTGKGVRVGMLEIDVYSKKAIDLYTRCLDQSMPDIEVTSVNASAKQLLQTNTETSLDIISLGLVAPGLTEAQVIHFSFCACGEATDQGQHESGSDVRERRFLCGRHGSQRVVDDRMVTHGRGGDGADNGGGVGRHGILWLLPGEQVGRCAVPVRISLRAVGRRYRVDR